MNRMRTGAMGLGSRGWSCCVTKPWLRKTAIKATKLFKIVKKKKRQVAATAALPLAEQDAGEAVAAVAATTAGSRGTAEQCSGNNAAVEPEAVAAESCSPHAFDCLMYLSKIN